MDSPPQRRNSRIPYLLGLGCLILIACLAVFSAVSFAGLYVAARAVDLNDLVRSTPPTVIEPTPTTIGLLPAPTSTPQPTRSTPVLTTPSHKSSLPTPTTNISPSTTPIQTIPPRLTPTISIAEEMSAQETLRALLETIYPPRDYYDSVVRLTTADIGKRTVLAKPFSVGEQHRFLTDEGDRDAELLAISEHAYFWVESTLPLTEAELTAAAEHFESEIYPQVTGLFGDLWQPGVDSDPRFSILHLDGYGENGELGFFNSGDEYPKTIYENSNEQELIYLNMASLRIGSQLYYGTLAHEFQHLIQWNQDPNEPIWFSEGLAQFTESYLGYQTVDSPFDYRQRPHVQLNDWEIDDQDNLLAHYGAAYLFVIYIWEQLGEQAIVDIIHHPADGLAGLYAILNNKDLNLSLESFLASWVAANFLDDDRAGPAYHYRTLDLKSPRLTSVVSTVPFSETQTINPLGVHYIDLRTEELATIHFRAEQVTTLYPPPPSGQKIVWYLPGQNDMDAHLTTTVDLAGLESADLNFWAWYDLETEYDFAYVTISTDGGNSWEILKPRHNKSGVFGAAFSGQSSKALDHINGWIPETISLSRYAGQQVMIRFEVMTDAALSGKGFAVDQITIPQLGADSELVWLPEGFLQAGSEIPLLWQVQLLEVGPNPRVIPLQLDADAAGSFQIDPTFSNPVLAITMVSPFTYDPVTYQLQIESDVIE